MQQLCEVMVIDMLKLNVERLTYFEVWRDLSSEAKGWEHFITEIREGMKILFISLSAICKV